MDGLVTLLFELFPNLLTEKNIIDLPKWMDKKKPWEIFQKNSEDSLISQITNLIIEMGELTPKQLKNIEVEYDIKIDVTNGPVYIHPEAKIGQYITIEGPSYVGKNVEIRHSAYLRKGSWLCENSVVGHASEIKNSILLPHSKAPHFNYVGDSILGFGVNLGAGTKLSNVRNDRQSIKITLDNNLKIDTDLKKLGTLIGDFTEIGCNVVSNPGTLIMPNQSVNPNLSIKGCIF